MKIRLMTAALVLAAAPAFAQDDAVDLTPTGDAAAGEAQYRQCATCHHVVDDAGNVLAGRANVRTGPNLFGVVGRTAGTVDGFRYSASMVKAGEESGLVWDEANFVAYSMDPTVFLREFLEDSSARGNMTYKVRREEDAINLYAYLASLTPTD